MAISNTLGLLSPIKKASPFAIPQRKTASPFSAPIPAQPVIQPAPVVSAPKPTPTPQAPLSAPAPQPQSAAPVTSSLTPPTVGTAPATAPITAPTPTTPTQPPVRGLFPSIVTSLAQRGNQPSPQYTEAYEQAQEYNRKLKESMTNEADALKTNYLNPIPIGDQEGRAKAIQDQYLRQQQALGAGFQGASSLIAGANTQQGLQQTALGTAGGLIPEALRYGVEGGSTFDPSVKASEYAKEVASGTRTYNDAVEAMGLYGDAGKQFLDSAIRQAQPNFNFSQAQSLGPTQGTIAPSLNMAQNALNNLQSTFASIPEWQRTSIPVVNSLTNMLATIGIGTGTATSKANAINEARTQVANALGVMTNTTPTSWVEMVSQWFPDNATPDQINAGMEQFNNLAKSRQSVFGQPGQVQPFTPQTPQTTSTGSGSLYDW